MDVAALQTISNADAYGELSASQYELSDSLGGGGFETGDMRSASTGITRITSGLQELGLISDDQVAVLSAITAVVGATYGAMMIYGAMKALINSAIAIQTAMAAYETAMTLAIPYVGVIIVAAAVGAVAGMYVGLESISNHSMLSTENEPVSIQSDDISTGTRRRQLANQLRSVT